MGPRFSRQGLSHDRLRRRYVVDAGRARAWHQAVARDREGLGRSTDRLSIYWLNTEPVMGAARHPHAALIGCEGMVSFRRPIVSPFPMAKPSAVGLKERS